MTPDEIRSYLTTVADRPSEPSPEAVREAIAVLKHDAVIACDEAGAKRLWCLEQALVIQNQYLHTFTLLKNGEFYQAWCALERTELVYRRS